MRRILMYYSINLLSMVAGFSSYAAAETESETMREDLVQIQRLINKKIIILDDGVLSLNQELLKSGLIQNPENLSITNCTSGDPDVD